MPQIERLDPRLCFSAGVDTTFGTNGRLVLTVDGAVHALAATADRVNVAYAAGSRVSSFAVRNDIGKYIGGIAAGTAGDNIGEVDQVLPLADGSAYALGATDTTDTPGGPRTHFLSVTRYTADGKPDPGFATDGTFVYDLSNTTTSDVTFVDAVPTADGGLVVGFDRARTASGRTLSEVVLLKLRASGNRDKSFGDHGTKVVFSAGYDPAKEAVIDTVAAYDLTANADGSVRVLLSRTEGIRLAEAIGDDHEDDDVGVNASVQFKSQTVTAAGADDPARARSWVLATPGEIFEDTRFAPLRVADDGPTGLTVIGRSRHGDAVSRPQAFVLRAGHRPRALPFATGKLTASQVLRTDTGKYFALLRGNAIARLTADFVLDTTFAKAGIARPDLSQQNPRSPLKLYAAAGDRAILPETVTGSFDDELDLLRFA